MDLKDRDEIKELFQKELGNYQMKVNPSVWSGVQSGIAGIGSSTAATGTIGLVGKIIIGGVVAAGLTVGAVLLNQKPSDENQNTHTESVAEVLHETTEQNNLVPIEEEEINTTVEENNLSNNEESFITIKEEQTVEVDYIVVEEKPLENIEIQKESIPETNEKNIVPFVKEQPQVKEEILFAELDVIEEENKLDDIFVSILKQENQYVEFIAENIPSDAELIWNFGNGAYSYTKQSAYFFEEGGDYTVTLTVSLGKEVKKINIPISVNIEGFIGELPNIFTPNGDGRNDELFIETKHLKSFQLTVMDKTQRTVYSTNDFNFKWDGTDKAGLPVPDGDYFYIIMAEDEAGNRINKYQQLRIQR